MTALSPLPFAKLPSRRPGATEMIFHKIQKFIFTKNMRQSHSPQRAQNSLLFGHGHVGQRSNESVIIYLQLTQLRDTASCLCVCVRWHKRYGYRSLGAQRTLAHTTRTAKFIHLEKSHVSCAFPCEICLFFAPSVWLLTHDGGTQNNKQKKFLINSIPYAAEHNGFLFLSIKILIRACPRSGTAGTAGVLCWHAMACTAHVIAKCVQTRGRSSTPAAAPAAAAPTDTPPSHSPNPYFYFCFRFYLFIFS